MKLTDKHFKLFKDECLEWIDIFKLDNWEVHFRRQKSKEARASISISISGYIATIFLSEEWNNYEGVPKNKIKEDIQIAAKHEVIHLLLGRLSCNAKARYISTDDLEESEEELVRKLEKLL